MELRDYIEAGNLKINGGKQLADYLGIHANSVTDAKAHRRGLPNDACFKLSQLLGVPVAEVIAASELATEKKEAKRQFWLPFVQNAQMGRIASYALILGVVTNFVTPTTAEAAPLLESSARSICLM